GTRNLECSRGAGARGLAAEVFVLENGRGTLGLRCGLRRPQLVRPLPIAFAGWLRTGGEAAGYRRRGSTVALSARNAAQRARSPGAAIVLQPRRCTGAGFNDGSQPGVGGASVRW